MKIINNLSQGSKLWLESRIWKVSWTKLFSVMAWPKAVDTFMYNLLAEKIAPMEENYVTPAMERGTHLEVFAIEEYEKITWDKVDQPWLIERDDFNICSPRLNYL